MGIDPMAVLDWPEPLVAEVVNQLIPPEVDEEELAASLGGWLDELPPA